MVAAANLTIFNKPISNIGFSGASAIEPADINNDNKVDIVDLSILLSNWNKTGTNTSDLNSDNTVDIIDLSILLSKWGSVTQAGYVMPTRENTGPRYPMTEMTPQEFYSTRTCDKRRIVGDVRIDGNISPAAYGQIYNITDCEITGSLNFYLIGGNQQLPSDQMPTININYTDIAGGVSSENAIKLNVDHSYVGNKIQLKISDGWPVGNPGYAPYNFTNSMIWNAYLSQPTHTEAFHTAGYGTSTSFTNVAFVQQGGPLANTGVTAVINFQGDGTVFDGCYFIWDGPVPAYYTAYIDGPNNIVKNSYFSRGDAGYIYNQNIPYPATFQNNRDYNSNQLINLP